MLTGQSALPAAAGYRRPLAATVRPATPDPVIALLLRCGVLVDPADPDGNRQLMEAA